MINNITVSNSDQVCEVDSLNYNIQFSHPVVSSSLQPHGLQHARPPCPSPNPGVYPNSCPSSRWSYPTISPSVVPFSSCPQSLPASGSFQMSQFFTSGGQSIGVSASTSVLPMNTRDRSPLGWTGWISLQSKALSRASSKASTNILSEACCHCLHRPGACSVAYQVQVHVHSFWSIVFCAGRLREMTVGAGESRVADWGWVVPLQTVWRSRNTFIVQRVLSLLAWNNLGKLWEMVRDRIAWHVACCSPRGHKVSDRTEWTRSTV